MDGFEIIKPAHNRDARGWNIHPIDYALLEAGGVDNIHIVSMEPGAIRGNHLHRRQTEYVFIIGGPCLVAAKNPETGEEFSIVVEQDDLHIFRASPGVAHAFKNVSGHTVYALCHSDLRFDPGNVDMEPFAVI